MAKIIAYAFSDFHLHDWSSYSNDHARLRTPMTLIKMLRGFSKEKNVPLLFCGDLIHNPKEISQYVFHELIKLRELDMNVWAISGNHDMCEKNTISKPSPSYLNSMGPNWKCIDNTRALINRDLEIFGIPYYNSELEFEEKLKELSAQAEKSEVSTRILMVHQNLPGAVEPDGFEVECEVSPRIYKLFDNFTWVLSGHIHKPQKIFTNTFMLGATHHQDLGDIGCEMGYWIIYDTRPPKFVPAGLPEFKRYQGNEIPNSWDMWVKDGEEESEEESEGVADFDLTSSRKSLAKQFCKEKGIDDKVKVKRLIKALNNAD